VFQTLVMYGLQSPVNIGMILRVCEIYGVDVLFFDYYKVFAEIQSRNIISDFSTGAMDRKSWTIVQCKQELLDKLDDCRIVCANPCQSAKCISSFEWSRSDAVVLGNEYDGLTAEFRSLADAQIRIPMPRGSYLKPTSHYPIDPRRSEAPANDGNPSLNVATTAAILCCFSYCSGMSDFGQVFWGN